MRLCASIYTLFISGIISSVYFMMENNTITAATTATMNDTTTITMDVTTTITMAVTTERLSPIVVTTSQPKTNVDSLGNYIIIVLGILSFLIWAGCLVALCRKKRIDRMSRGTNRGNRGTVQNSESQTHEFDYEPPPYETAVKLPKPDIRDEFAVHRPDGIHVFIVEGSGEVCETTYSMTRDAPVPTNTFQVFQVENEQPPGSGSSEASSITSTNRQATINHAARIASSRTSSSSSLGSLTLNTGSHDLVVGNSHVENSAILGQEQPAVHTATLQGHVNQGFEQDTRQVHTHNDRPSTSSQEHRHSRLSSAGSHHSVPSSPRSIQQRSRMSSSGPSSPSNIQRPRLSSLNSHHGMLSNSHSRPLSPLTLSMQRNAIIHGGSTSTSSDLGSPAAASGSVSGNRISSSHINSPLPQNENMDNVFSYNMQVSPPGLVQMNTGLARRTSLPDYERALRIVSQTGYINSRTHTTQL